MRKPVRAAEARFLFIYLSIYLFIYLFIEASI